MPGRNRWHDHQRGGRYTCFQSRDLKDVTFEVSSGSESVGRLTRSCANPETGGNGAFKQLVVMGPQGRAGPRPSLPLDRFLECPSSSHRDWFLGCPSSSHRDQFLGCPSSSHRDRFLGYPSSSHRDRFLGCPSSSQSPRVPAKPRSMSSLPRR